MVASATIVRSRGRAFLPCVPARVGQGRCSERKSPPDGGSAGKQRSRPPDFRNSRKRGAGARWRGAGDRAPGWSGTGLDSHRRAGEALRSGRSRARSEAGRESAGSSPELTCRSRLCKSRSHRLCRQLSTCIALLRADSEGRSASVRRGPRGRRCPKFAIPFLCRSRP